MRQVMLNHAVRCSRHYHSSNSFKLISKSLVLPLKSTRANFKNFSSNSNSNPNPNPNPETSSDVEDVSTRDLKVMINKYYEQDDEEMVPSLLEAILKRKLSNKHEETDDELMDQLQNNPSGALTESDFESESGDSDEEIEDLYKKVNGGSK